MVSDEFAADQWAEREVTQIVPHLPGAYGAHIQETADAGWGIAALTSALLDYPGAFAEATVEQLKSVLSNLPANDVHRQVGLGAVDAYWCEANATTP